MPHKQRVYRSRNPRRIIFTVILAVLLAAVILCVGVFFWFRKYIVYTADGVRLEIPWFQTEQVSSLSEVQS